MLQGASEESQTLASEARRLSGMSWGGPAMSSMTKASSMTDSFCDH